MRIDYKKDEYGKKIMAATQGDIAFNFSRYDIGGGYGYSNTLEMTQSNNPLQLCVKIYFHQDGTMNTFIIQAGKLVGQGDVRPGIERRIVGSKFDISNDIKVYDNREHVCFPYLERFGGNRDEKEYRKSGENETTFSSTELGKKLPNLCSVLTSLEVPSDYERLFMKCEELRKREQATIELDDESKQVFEQLSSCLHELNRVYGKEEFHPCSELGNREGNKGISL